mgnify:CR=1
MSISICSSRILILAWLISSVGLAENIVKYNSKLRAIEYEFIGINYRFVEKSEDKAQIRFTRRIRETDSRMRHFGLTLTITRGEYDRGY